MTAGAGTYHLDRRSPRWQISLRALILLVLAAGVAAGIVRSARDVWGNRLIEPLVIRPGQMAATGTSSSPVPVQRTAGLFLEVEAVFLLLILARDLTGLIRSGVSRSAGGSALAPTAREQRFVLLSIAWRLASVGLLLWFLSLESSVLRVDYASEIEASLRQPGWGWNYRAHHQVLGAGQILTIVIGFAVFGSGLAARSLDLRPTRENPRWMARLSTILRSGVLAVVLLAVLKCLPSTSQFEPRVPSLVKLLYDALEQANGWLWGRFPDPIVVVISPWFQPEQLLWTLMVVGVAVLLLELAIRPASAHHAPFDRIVAAPQSVFQFGWLVVALTCVCPVALPTLIIGGQALWHVRLSLADWRSLGRPR